MSNVDDLAPIDAAQKTRLLDSIAQNMYVPKRADWNTLRKNFGPRDFLIRIVSCTLVLILAYGIGAKTPRAREDREWILEFSVVMMLFFAVIHALSFLPANLFNSPA